MTTSYIPMSSSDLYEDDIANPPHTARPHSIDLTLELEHQLDIESVPSSPTFSQARSRPQSLDPHILASIITQLRISLTEVTKERDDLSMMLAETQSNEASMKDALHHLADKCVRLETELAASMEKNKEDTDAIAMLRGKLEDSRRALMRLQTENRRTSQISTMTLDLPRGGPATSNAAKRASFIPLTNTPAGRTNAHRRISSVSEPGSTHLEQSQWASSPPATSTEFSQPPPSAFSGSSNRRQSGFWARPLSLQPDHPPMVDPAEFDETRKEVQTLREQLEAMKGDLAEAQEAQEASETCVKALRTFIAENSIGVQTTTTGPALTSPVTRTEEISKPSLASKWGFKLWKVDTTSNPTPSNISPAPQSPPASTPVNSAPLTKFGGLFSARTSISSVSNHRPDLPPRSQDMACNTSDSSSLEDVVAEPISPVSETPRSHVAIHVAGEPSTEMLLFPSQIKELHSFHEPTAVSPS